MQARSLALAGVVLAAAVVVVMITAGPDRGVVVPAADADADATVAIARAAEEDAALQRSAAVLPQAGLRAHAAADDAPTRWVLEGRVSELDGRGVAGCVLILASGVGKVVDENLNSAASQPLSRTSGNPIVLAETVAGPAGEWRIELPRPLERMDAASGASGYAILAEAAGHRDAGQLLDGETVRNGGVCEIVMVAGATLRGRVVGADGAPVQGAVVTGSRWFAQYTGASGSFRFETRADVEFDLAAIHASGTAVRTGIVVPLGTESDLGDLVLLGPGALAGRVVFPDGSPAPHLPLSVMEEGFGNRRTVPNAERAGGNHQGWTRTDEAGRFRLAGLREGRFQISARVPQGEFPLAATADAESHLHFSGGAGELELLLPWHLLLLDLPPEPDGVAAQLLVAATPARADGAPPAEPDFVPIVSANAYWGAHPVPLLFTGPGWLRVQATATDGRVALARVELAESEWLHRCALGLAAAGERGAILIRARRADGTRYDWLNCQLHDPARGLVGRAETMSETEDGWLLEGVPAGAWRLTVADGQGQRAFDLVLPGEFAVVVRGGETTVVEWTPVLGAGLELLADTDGTGAAGGVQPHVRVTVLAGPASVGELLLLLPTGAHRPVPPTAAFLPGVLMKLAAPLPAGDYRLRFSASGFAEQEASVRLVAGEVARCAVRLASAR
jgi:hypothetical protein